MGSLASMYSPYSVWNKPGPSARTRCSATIWLSAGVICREKKCSSRWSRTGQCSWTCLARIGCFSGALPTTNRSRLSAGARSSTPHRPTPSIATIPCECAEDHDWTAGPLHYECCSGCRMLFWANLKKLGDLPCMQPHDTAPRIVSTIPETLSGPEEFKDMMHDGVVLLSHHAPTANHRHLSAHPPELLAGLHVVLSLRIWGLVLCIP